VRRRLHGRTAVWALAYERSAIQLLFHQRIIFIIPTSNSGGFILNNTASIKQELFA